MPLNVQLSSIVIRMEFAKTVCQTVMPALQEQAAPPALTTLKVLILVQLVSLNVYRPSIVTQTIFAKHFLLIAIQQTPQMVNAQRALALTALI